MPYCLPIGQNLEGPASFSHQFAFMNLLKYAPAWESAGAKYFSSITLTNNNPSPATVTTGSAHGLSAGAAFNFVNIVGGGITAPTESTTGGALRINRRWTYYVMAAGLTSSSFQFSNVPGGTAVVITDSGNYTTIDIDFNLTLDNIPLDANQYPTSLTLLNGAGTATYFTSVTLRINDVGTALYVYHPGTYVCLYAGGGTVSLDPISELVFVEGNGTTRDIYYSASPNQQGFRFRIVPPITSIALVWSPGSYGPTGQGGGGQTGPANKAGDNETAYLGGKIFSDDLINKLQNYKCIRFMHSVGTLSDPTQLWANRSFPSQFTYANNPATEDQKQKIYVGWPWDICVALCNVLHCDGWFCVPFCASDGYINSLIAFLDANLNPGLHAYMEYGNESWNPSAINGWDGYNNGATTIYTRDPFNFCVVNGVVVFPDLSTSDPDTQLRYFSYWLMIHQADLIAAAYPGNPRFVRIGSGQNGFTGRNQFQLALLDTIFHCTKTWTGAAGTHWDAFTVSWYFPGYDSCVAWTADSDGGAGKSFAEMETGLIPTGGIGQKASSGGPSAYTVTTGNGYTDGTCPNGTFVVVSFNSPTATISSGSYNSVTGNVTLTLNTSLGVGVGTNVNISGATGTGSFAAINGTQNCITGTGGSTVIFTIGTGLTMTITGGNLISWNNANATIQVDSMTARTLAINDGSSSGRAFGANTFAPGNVLVLCFTSQTSQGAVSPPVWQTSGTNANLLGYWGGWSNGVLTTPVGSIQMVVDFFNTNWGFANGGYGLRLICYEGGQSLLGGTTELNTLYAAMQSNSGMFTAYESTAIRFSQINNKDLLVAFEDTGLGPWVGSSNYWGTLVNQLDIPGPLTPKYNALMDLASCPTTTVVSPQPRSRRVVHYHHVAGT